MSAVFHRNLSFEFSHASQIFKPQTEAANNLNTCIFKAKAIPDKGLQFFPLDPDSVQLIVFADTSFTSNTYLTSPVGFVIVLSKHFGRANIFHYTSVNSKEVTRCFLAAELFAEVMEFDYGSILRITLNKIFDRFIPLILYTDSKSLYDILVDINSTTEKRLLIDIYMLRQYYELKKLTEAICTPSEQNPSDALTKRIILMLWKS